MKAEEKRVLAVRGLSRDGHSGERRGSRHYFVKTKDIRKILRGAARWIIGCRHLSRKPDGLGLNSGIHIVEGESGFHRLFSKLH